MTGRTRKLIIGLTAAALAGGAFAISTGISSAGENCTGLDQALQNNLNFIAAQRANPDALSDARIANRQAVVDLINQRRATAGCTGKVGAQPPAAAAPTKTTAAPAAPPAGNAAAKGVVCKGSTVTFFADSDAPAASSGTFPIGTTLKVTNLANNKSITVKVTTPSASCVLLNTAAFNLVHEAGKNVIRQVVVERVG
jgi:hypothetical protein